MKCKQVQTALAIAPREWSEAERQQIEAHLPTCATCAAIARDYDRQTDQLTALPRLSLSMAQQQTIMSQVARMPQYLWSRRLGNAFGAAAGVLLLGVLVVSLLWLFNHPTSLSLTATVTSVLTPTMTSTPTATLGTPSTQLPLTWLHYNNPDLGFAVDYPADWTVESTADLYPDPDPLGRPGIRVVFGSNLYAYDDPDSFGRYYIDIAVKDSLGKTLTETVDNELSPLVPQFRSEVVRDCCLIIGGQEAVALTHLPYSRWGVRVLIVLSGGREYRLTFVPSQSLSSDKPSDIRARVAFETFLKTFTFISLPQPLSSRTLTPRPAPIEPTPALSSPASPPTGMLPDGIFATATPVMPDPVYATQEAAYQATREASSATPIARAVASPFPAVGPNVASVHAIRGCFSSGMSGLGCEA